ncbi:unnamed protein product [Effrenium voratum]|uniref:Uncharacterized protein n=1 Tax=Effrenium voratum TaxID=2562239 RepID=A0AA36I9Y8_9DINO|nr:unnamed protein product [Effrenium voratum]
MRRASGRSEQPCSAGQGGRIPRSYAMEESGAVRGLDSRKHKPRVQVMGEEEQSTPASRSLAMRFPSRAESCADLDNLSWLNAVLSWLWPNLNRALTEIVHEDLTPRLQESLPSFFRNISFSRFTLGNSSPELGPVQVKATENNVDIVLDLNYQGDVDVSVDTGNGLCFGIRQLTCNGKMCISLRLLRQQFPIVGAAQIFFPVAPEVDLQFTGLAALGHFPGIEHTIRRSVMDWLKSLFVLPRCKAILSGEVDPMEAMAPQPLGVLHARVVRARDLAGVNCHAFEQEVFTSHPYCILSLGDASRRTSTVRDTTCPQWPAEEPGSYFVVHHREQHLEVEVRAEDSGSIFSHNFTGFLGRVSCRIARMRRWPEAAEAEGARRVHHGSLDLDTSQVSRDLLHVDDPLNRGLSSVVDLEVRWFEIAGSPAGDVALEAPAAVVVEIAKGSGYPPEAAAGRGVRWRTWMQGDEAFAKVTKKGLLTSNELQFPPVGINPRLLPVIDNLAVRNYSVEAMAIIVGISEELVTSYLKVRDEFKHRREELQQAQSQDDFRLDAQWFERIVHVCSVADLTKKLCMSLLDHQDVEVGCLEPICLRSTQSGFTVHRLQAASQTGGLASWFVPSQSRFARVEMEVSVRVCQLRQGNELP